MRIARWTVGLVLLAASAIGAEGDPKDLFAAPVALADAAGVALTTGQAQGCPFAADYNGDGKTDLILGAKLGMDSSRGGIWLIPNKGSNEQPAFAWADGWRVKLEGAAELSVGCGCKSSGQVQPVAVDWNGDGYLDLVYSDTYQRAYLLLNDGKSREQPSFKQEVFFDMEKKNHGMYAGGGDWNGDGVLDFLHMTFAGAQFKVFKGTAHGSGGIKFTEGGLPMAEVLKFHGERPRKCAWAWDYSGTSKSRGVIEFVGVAKRAEGGEEIAYYELANGESKKLATLVVPDGQTPLLTACDLNADGKKDLLYSCGLWNNEREKTKVYVMYGK